MVQRDPVHNTFSFGGITDHTHQLHSQYVVLQEDRYTYLHLNAQNAKHNYLNLHPIFYAGIYEAETGANVGPQWH